MNFTHIYEQESLLKNKDFEWIDCSEISGTNCYCDDDAINKLTEKIASYGPDGIHFIDSGNYHYLSKLWTDKITRPFSLVVFDHHPDMQPSLFDNLLSCGCWVKEVLDSNPFIRKVCIVGASEMLIKNVDTSYQDRLIFYSDQALNHEETWKEFAHLHLDGPVYISVDKDVLNTESAVTNWDQGSLSLATLEKLLSIILKNQEVIGVDICGECSTTLNKFEIQKYIALNNRANEELVRLFKAYRMLYFCIEPHPLEPFLPLHAKVLLLGSFPPQRSRWSMNFFYPNFQNDMWRIMGLIFFENPLHFVTGRRFDEVLVRQFCEEKGIALYDTAQSVIRQNNNASDKFLEVVIPVDLAAILARIPECNTIATTGQKATEILLTILSEGKEFNQQLSIPAPGSFVIFLFNQRSIRLYRMPSSSRAYPKPLKEKAEAYKELFR